MTVTGLILHIRAHGGGVKLGEGGRIEIKSGKIEPRAWTALKRRLLVNKESVLSVLREERASRYWEASGRDRSWHRSYPYSGTLVSPSCECKERQYPHVHLDRGPDPNCKLEPGESCWDALMQLLRDYKCKTVQ